MSKFTQGITASFNKHIKSIRDAHARHLKAAERRATASLARAKSQAERDRIRTNLEIEKLKLRKSLEEARTAAVKAKGALKKAKREAGDISFGERVSRGVAGLRTGTTKAKKKGKGLGSWLERQQKSLSDF